MNYDRRLIEALKRKQQEFRLPFLKTFILVTALLFALSFLVH